MAFSKTVALITGASQGIGYEIARRLARENSDYIVAMTGRRKEANEEVVKKLQEDGLVVEPLLLDVTSDELIATAIKAVEAKHGRLDVLVNNAAICSHIDPTEISEAAKMRKEWTAIFDTNVFSVSAVTDAFLPLMKKSIEAGKPRCIVFVSSAVASMSYKSDPKHPWHVNVLWKYTTSKMALNMLAWHYMVEFEGDVANWKINITCPGYCSTRLSDYVGTDSPETGSINTVRLATLGPNGETARFSSRDGPLLW
ncbi:MAG: hypothetical protein STHCBS139747_000396 [Sporothrix thermara]